jgi:hypothetical protein
LAIKDTVLRDVGLWFRGEEHVRDAARHLLLWVRKQGGVEGGV